MKTIAIALYGLYLSGCTSAKLGDNFDADQEYETVGHSRIVVYADKELDEGIYFDVSLDDERVGRLFADTYVSSQSVAATRRITIQEFWTGKGIGKGFREIFTKPLADPDPNLPESLNVGARTLHTATLEQGQTTFLRVEKIPYETLYRCKDTTHTVSVCKSYYSETRIRQVAANEARRQLTQLKESL